MEGWAEWRMLLNEGLICRRRKELNWKRWRLMYERAGVDTFRGQTDDSLMKVYLVRTLTQILLPSLYFKDPYVVVTPQVYDNDMAEDSATSMEAWLNYFVSSPGIMQTEKNVRKAVLDALVVNEGYVETKWRYSTEEVPIAGAGGRLTFDYVTEDNPYINWVSIYDICEDPYSLGGLDSARWVARRKWFPIEAIRENRVFNKSVRLKFDVPERVSAIRRSLKNVQEYGLRALKNRGLGGGNMETALDEEYEGFAQLWYIYDLKYQRHVVMNPDVEGFLIDTDNPYEHLNKFPIKKLSFEYDNDVEQPQSMVETIISQQREANHIVNRQHQALRKFVRIVEVPEGELISEVDEDALLNGEDGSIIYVKVGGKIREIPWEDRDTAVILDKLRGGCFSDAQFHYGIPATQTSLGHSKFKSATEVTAIASAYDIRLDDMREQVSQWYEAVITDLGDNIQVFLDDSRKFMIAGQVRTVGPAQLMGPKFKYSVDLSEGMPENQQKRLERFAQLYQMVKDEPLLDRGKILMDLMRAMTIHRPKYYMAGPQGIEGQELGIPGNVPPYSVGGAMPPEAGAMAMAPPGQEAMMMGGQGAEMGSAGGAELMAMLGGLQ